MSESQDLVGQVSVVTGAGAGIGRAIARRLAAGGAFVVVTDKHEGRMEETVALIEADGGPGGVAGYRLDIELRHDFDHVFGEVHKTHGPITNYVWNAALNIPEPVFEQDAELLDRILYANINNCWYSCRAVAEQMKTVQGGVITMIGSMAPDVGAVESEPPYAMSKAAVRALSQGIAKAGGPFNIRCNDVIMGLVTGTRFTDTRPDMADEWLQSVPLGRHGAVTDIAEAVAFLSSDRASFITGTVINVTGGALLGL